MILLPEKCINKYAPHPGIRRSCSFLGKGEKGKVANYQHMWSFGHLHEISPNGDLQSKSVNSVKMFTKITRNCCLVTE